MLTSEQRALLKRMTAPAAPPAIDVAALCHPLQAALVLDPSRNVVAVCGRRSGKSVAAIVRCLIGALGMANVNCLFIAATRASAKKLGWKVLRDLNRVLKLGGVENWTELSLLMPNGSCVYLMGVDSEKAADLVRGVSRLAFVAVDEVQRGQPGVLTTLIKDVIRPALRDVSGTLWLLGTPNPKGKTGVLWERWEAGLFSRHAWTIYDNSKLGTREETDAIIVEDLKAEGETKESAFFLREYMAQWVVDLDSRVYKFDDSLNLYDELPDNLSTSLLVADIGWQDADAIGDYAWSDDDPTMWLRTEDIARAQTVSQLGDKLAALYELHESILIGIDAGGGGKKTLESLRAMMPRLPLVACQKPDLKVQIKALNDRLVPGQFKVHRSSQFARDVRQVGWVKGLVGGKIDELSFHSDIVPTGRYAAILARPFLPDAKPPMTQEQAEAAEEAEVRAARIKKAQRLWMAGGDEDDVQTEDWEQASE